MKKILFIEFAVCLLMSCKDEKARMRDAEQKVEDDLIEMQIQQKEHLESMQHLVDVAGGLTGAGVRERYNALKKLREEYPQLKERWDELEEDILKLE